MKSKREILKVDVWVALQIKNKLEEHKLIKMWMILADYRLIL